MISKLAMLRCIDPQLSKHLNELLLLTKDLALSRYDRSMLSLKLKHKPSERDRSELRHLEKRVDEQRCKFDGIVREIQQLDAVIGSGQSQLGHDIRMHGLV